MTSRDPLDRPLHGVAVYNPDLLSKQELIAHFVARRSLLDRLVEDLGREGATQHHLLIGQRGMGKTTLLRRLRHAVEDDPALDRQWIPLTFPEEQYNISRLSDLYLNCIDALGDALEQRGRHAEARKLDAAVASLPDRDEPERAARALDILLSQADKLGRRLLLLVDNLELIFDRLKQHQWGIRELLSEEKRLLLIGASSAPMEITYKYKEPFYEFFQSHELRGLTEEETREVLLNLAHLDQAVAIERLIAEEPARIRTLHLLTGGNPRTIVLLYSVLSQGTDGDVRSDLERLLDQCTPLYKARFESLPAQAQQIVDALAIHWDPITAGELAGAIRLETNAVSSQLNRLAQQGVVGKVSYHPSNKAGFQIAERFFNIWYLMRASRRVRRRLIWLVEFLKLLYNGDEMRELARHHLRSHGQRKSDANARLRHAEYGLALAQVVEDTPLRNALESTAIHALTVDRSLRRQIGDIVDLEGADSSLKPVADRHQAAAEIQESIVSAEAKWGSIDRHRFAELLGGSPSLTISHKSKIAASLTQVPADRIQLIFNALSKELWEYSHIYRSETIAHQLWNSIRNGYMTDAHDVAGAEAAKLSIGADALPTIALAHCAERNKSANHADICASLSVASSPFPLLVMGDLLQMQPHRLDDAEVAYRRAIELDPTYAAPWHKLGILFHFHLNRFDDAEAAYRKAIDLDPTIAIQWDNIGRLLKGKLNRFDDAEVAYRKAIDLDPTYAAPWYGLGSLFHFHLKRYDDAEAAYRNAVDLDPTYAAPWYGLGSLFHFHLKRYDDAEAAYRKFIELEPTDAVPWDGLGNLFHFHLNRFDDAEAAYRKVIDLDPASADPWNSLGDLFKDKLNRFDDAEAAYRKAICLDPAFGDPWNSLGNLFKYKLNRFDDAETAYRKAIKLAPSEAEFSNSLSWLLYQSNKLGPEAEHTARYAASLNPDSTYILHTLATILVHHGNWTEAAPLARRFLTEGSSEFHEENWPDILTFFSEAARTSHAADAVALLDDLDLTDLYRPLREALAAIAAGTRAYLRRVAPEIRQPAERLIDELLPAGLD